MRCPCVLLAVIVLLVLPGCAWFVPQDIKDARVTATAEMKALVADVERGVDVRGEPITLERILPILKLHLKIDQDECAFFKGQKPEVPE